MGETESRADGGDLLGGLIRGDDNAAREMMRRFWNEIVGLAERNLDKRLQRFLSGEDAAASVLRSFFEHPSQFHFDDWDGVWALLVFMTKRKCIEKARYFKAKKRDARKTVTAEEIKTGLAQPATEEDVDAAGDLVVDLVNWAAEMNGTQGKAIEMSLMGVEVHDIVAQLNCSERTVQRGRARLKARLEKMARA